MVRPKFMEKNFNPTEYRQNLLEGAKQEASFYDDKIKQAQEAGDNNELFWQERSKKKRFAVFFANCQME